MSFCWSGPMGGESGAPEVKRDSAEASVSEDVPKLTICRLPLVATAEPIIGDSEGTTPPVDIAQFRTRN